MRVFTRTELCERLGVCARIRHKTGGGFHRAVAQKELSRPDDGFAPVSDSQSTLLARITRIYGIAAPVETVGSYERGFGFIID